MLRRVTKCSDTYRFITYISRASAYACLRFVQSLSNEGTESSSLLLRYILRRVTKCSDTYRFMTYISRASAYACLRFAQLGPMFDLNIKFGQSDIYSMAR